MDEKDTKNSLPPEGSVISDSPPEPAAAANGGNTSQGYEEEKHQEDLQPSQGYGEEKLQEDPQPGQSYEQGNQQGDPQPSYSYGDSNPQGNPQPGQSYGQGDPQPGYSYGDSSPQGNPQPGQSYEQGNRQGDPQPGYSYGDGSPQGAPPPSYQYGGSAQQGYGTYTPKKRTNGMALASLIVGIVSILMCCCGLGAALGAVGIVLAILSRGKEPMETNAKIGLGLSIAGVVLGVMVFLLALIAVGNSDFQSYIDQGNRGTFDDFEHYFEEHDSF